MTILTMANKKDTNRETLVGEARRALVQQFSSLDQFQKDYLLRAFFDDLNDPSLIGPLKTLLADNSNMGRGTHGIALQRLMDIAPDQALPYVVAEVCAPFIQVDREVLGRLSNKSLPGVDKCLLEQLAPLSMTGQTLTMFLLEQKAEVMSRYATENIYHDVLSIYRERKAWLSSGARAAILAYLAKYNEAEAMPLIEQTLAEGKPEEDSNFLPTLTKLYYSSAVGELVKKRLELDEPRVAANAAYLLGVHGEASDELVLQARLQRWRKEWGERVIEADGNRQGRIESELVYALLHGKSWKVSGERAQELKGSCVTKACKANNR